MTNLQYLNVLPKFSSAAPTKIVPPKNEIQAERCRRDFHIFVRNAWPVIEQAAQFVDNWHVGIICEYLEALYSLQVHNLIINIPPGHAKSLLCSVLFPPWVWTKNPESRFFCGSHASDLATRDAVRSRRLMQSDWYQERFGESFQMTSDQNVKTRYENDKTGHRISVSTEGGWTGHRGNYIIWDDPLDLNKKNSDTERAKANEAVKSSFATRGDNPAEMRRLMIMQRLHDDDPTGHIVQAMKDDENFPQFEMLVLPARYEPNRFFSTIGLTDLRTEPGELLFPQLFSEQVLNSTEALLGPLDTAGQMQQRPVPAGGLIFLREWWEQGRNRYAPGDRSWFNKTIATFLFYDTAFTDKETSDATARIQLNLLPDYRVYLADAWWKKMQVPFVADEVNNSTARLLPTGKHRATVVENKSSGIGVLQQLRLSAPVEIADMLREFNPGSASKEERARRSSQWCARDCILLPEPSDEVPWLFDFEEQIFKAPNTKLKDLWDCFAMSISYMENILAAGYFARQGWNTRTPKSGTMDEHEY